MPKSFMRHPDPDVEQAITQLCEALLMWESNSGRDSVLIVREAGGFVFRAVSGKPCAGDDDIPDSNLVTMIGE
jgi:hypothetical protein